MGSTSTSTSAALISHLQLNKSCFKLVESTRTHLKLNSIKFSDSRRGRLELGASRTRKGVGRAVCFAAIDDDVKENRQQDFSKTTSASAVEDRPGTTTNQIIPIMFNLIHIYIQLSIIALHRAWSHCCSFFFFLISYRLL